MGIRQDERQIYNLQIRRLKDLNKRLAALYEDSRDKLLLELTKYRVSITKGGIVRKSKEERLVRFIREINQEITKLTGKTSRAIRGDFIKTFESTYYLEAYAVEKSINTQLNLGASYSLNLPELQTKQVLAAFDKRIGGLITTDRINRAKTTLQYLVQDAVAQNIIEGQSVSALNKNLKLIDNAMDAGFKNTQRIARTELLKAYSLGQDEMRVEAEKSGVDMVELIWTFVPLLHCSSGSPVGISAGEFSGDCEGRNMFFP